MAVNEENYRSIIGELRDRAVLVAVSKMKSVEEIHHLYQLGQRDFGENYVQELLDKQSRLPEDVHWHFIGHLQSNKVKYIAPFIHLVHGVDSANLLKEINKQAKKLQREIKVLLQVHIAEEETKYGLNENELHAIMQSSSQFQYLKICGLMGMASFTDDQQKITNEFRLLNKLFQQYKSADATGNFAILSMGMSSDYRLAIEEGSNMVRIGSLLFGPRMK
jgi:pyridoxal phosphate enzyme (YggS family)